MMNSINVELILYADDATCIFNAPDSSQALATTISALDSLSMWFHANHLKLHREIQVNDILYQ